MNTEIVRGIIIKEVFVGDSDKIITILCKDIGKISVSCKGSRKAKSKTVSGSTLFTYADFSIFTGLKHYKLNSVTIIKSFYDVSKDYDKLIIASYFAEITNKITFESEENNELLKLLVYSLRALLKEDSLPLLICAIFNIRLSVILGFSPNLTRCSVCDTEDLSLAFFSYEGVVCNDCNKGYVKLSPPVLSFLQLIVTSDLTDIFNYTSSSSNVTELFNLANDYINSHIDVKINSLAML